MHPHPMLRLLADLQNALTPVHLLLHEDLGAQEEEAYADARSGVDRALAQIRAARDQREATSAPTTSDCRVRLGSLRLIQALDRAHDLYALSDEEHAALRRAVSIASATARGVRSHRFLAPVLAWRQMVLHREDRKQEEAS